MVGLTGGIGAGKTTVAQLLARRGAVVLDVDAIGREVVGPSGVAVDAVAARFGEDLRTPDGGIDRSGLAGRVFGDEEAIAALNAISHPAIDAVLDETLTEVAATSPDSIVVLDMAVLAESQLGRATSHPYELVVVVEAPRETRLDRLESRGLAREHAVARMASQASDAQRRGLADFVIGNGGPPEDLAGSVAQLWDRLQQLHDQKRGR